MPHWEGKESRRLRYYDVYPLENVRTKQTFVCAKGVSHTWVMFGGDCTLDGSSGGPVEEGFRWLVLEVLKTKADGRT